MIDSAKLIHCRKCKKITAHELLGIYTARCLKYGNVVNLKNPHVLEAERVAKGDPRKA